MKLKTITAFFAITWAVSTTVSAQKVSIYSTTSTERWVEKNRHWIKILPDKRISVFILTVCYRMLLGLEVLLMNLVGMPCNACLRQNVIK